MQKCKLVRWLGLVLVLFQEKYPITSTDYFIGLYSKVITLLYHRLRLTFGIVHIVCYRLVSACGFACYEQFISLLNL